MTSKIKIVYPGLTFLMLLVFSGCIATSELYHGKPVSPDRVVSIQDGGPHADSVVTFDVIINYKFVRNGDVLELSGQASLTDRYSVLYGSIDYLYTYLFFVDDASRVLETVSLATTPVGSPDQRIEFARSLVVPVGATGISFGYKGQVSEGGDDHSSPDSFDRLPNNQ